MAGTRLANALVYIVTVFTQSFSSFIKYDRTVPTVTARVIINLFQAFLSVNSRHTLNKIPGHSCNM